MYEMISASNKLACVVVYGAVKSRWIKKLGLDFRAMPQVGDFNHWNVKKVVPCVVVNGECLDLRTGEPVTTPSNSTIWPLLHGTVITYPDGTKILLSRSCDCKQTLLIDVTDQPVLPITVTSMVAKN